MKLSLNSILKLKGIINSKSEIKRKAEFASFHDCPSCVMILSLCVCFSFSWEEPTLLDPLAKALSRLLFKWNLLNEIFPIWWGTNDGKIRHYVLHDMDVIHGKYSSLPIKYNFKKVEAPSKQAPQSNNQFIRNIWTERWAKWHPKENN